MNTHFNTVNKTESRLFYFAIIFSTIIWVALTIGTFGFALLGFAGLWVLSLFAKGSYIAYIKGNSVELSEQQFPELYQAFLECCKDIPDLKKIPKVFIRNGNGVFNAFAMHFFATNFVVLNASIVNALADNHNAIKFVMGHELGHIKQSHHFMRIYCIPAFILPFVGPAYSRACEYTCDAFGLFCAKDLNDSQLALATLACGAEKYKSIDLKQFSQQMAYSKEFFNSLNELLASHPWLCKRVEYIRALQANEKPNFPRRSILSYIPCAVILNLTQSTLINFIITAYLAIFLLAGIS